MAGKSVRLRVRKKRKPPREIALRQRIENAPAQRGNPYEKVPSIKRNRKGEITGIRMIKGNSLSEWGLKAFYPKYGRMPTENEMLAALDSGKLGLWLEARSKGRVIKREIVVTVNGRETVMSISQFREKKEKPKDLRWVNEQKALAKEFRDKRWKAEAQNNAIQLALAGTINVSQLEATAQAYIANANRKYEIDKLFV